MIEVLLILCAISVILIKTKKNLHMLQQNLYNDNNRYIKWIRSNYKEFFNLEIIIIILIVFANFIFLKKDIISTIINLIAIITYIIYINKKRKVLKQEQVKKPLVVTARIKRLIGTITILYLIPLIILIIYRNKLIVSYSLILIFIILTYLNMFVILIANFINKYTLEKIVYFYFKNRALKKIKSMSNLKVVGITGSYGKTSSKNILTDILNVKYVTLKSPKNFNTPYGLIITINNYLDKFTDVFVAEMGAYVKGEIKELCDLVKPKYGILTKIGTAHLESFGSEENIINTKFELIESLPLDGVGILNKDDIKQVNYKLKNKCKIVWIGILNDDADVVASDIECSNSGTSFNVTLKNDNTKYKFETKLLGKHNVYNILAGIALGIEFGIPISKLVQAVKNVRPIEHRLELKKMGYFYQIDDAYNSNPIGALRALEVLAMMPGLRVVVTPGMIELGEKEEELNKEFGRQIATVSKAFYVILIGDNKTKPIKEGLLAENYNEDNIIVYNNVLEAYNFIRGINTKKEIYALFENDLPDIYNEK